MGQSLLKKIHHPDLRAIEQREREENHFTQGLNFYKLFWIFFMGSFVGVVIEEIWCVCTLQHFESRTGLVLGPFNLVYGFGALAVALGLHWLRYRRDGAIMIGGFLIGSAVEYICSFVQEKLFGTTSWDYSDMPLNLNGRITFFYSMFWGILAIFWVKDLYPRIALLLLKIPNKVGKVLTWILLAYMIINTVVSAVALNRWVERRDGIAATSAIERATDKAFPDQSMEWIYSNMIFPTDKSE